MEYFDADVISIVGGSVAWASRPQAAAMIYNLVPQHAGTQFCYYIPEKRKFSGILCFRQQRSRRRRVTISLSAR